MNMARTYLDGELLNLANRMLAPFQREFGQRLDVEQLLSNRTYARTVLEKAQTSKEERLRAYALMAQERLFGPRTGAGALPSWGSATAAHENDVSSGSEQEGAQAERMRARLMKRYRSGLR